MSEETRPNLEPIDEGDLNLKGKFRGETEHLADVLKEEAEIEKIEHQIIPSPEAAVEKSVERKEGSVERETAYSKILSKVSPQNLVIHDDVKEDAEIANREQDLDGKITNLTNLAQLKGIPHAVKVARHLEDNYILDELHDRMLGEELHKALVAKGMIKEL